VLNGDFEIGPYFMAGTISGWTVSGTGRVVDSANEGATTGSHAAALDEGGNSQGNILSQTIATTAGVSYIFEFDSGIFGTPSASPQLHFQAFGNSSLIDETIPVPQFNTSNPALVEFHHYFRTFTADSTSTTIRFSDVGLGNANGDLIVDSVSVVVAPPPTPAPTPSTLPLVNGDFESWPFNNPGTVAGWTVTGNKHIETISQGATSPIHSAGFSVGGDSTNNVLLQSFNTIAGQTYTFDFDSGVYGVHGGSPLQLQAQVIGSSPFFMMNVTPPEAGSIHPSQIVFQHYRFMFVASGTLATVQFIDTVGNNAGADVMLDSVSILPVPPSFLQWQATNFTVSQRGDPSISGWTADPDRDGIGNGLEYYFHMDPIAGVRAADQPSLPHTGLSFDGVNTYVTFSYHRLLGWGGNAPVVAVSNDLIAWDTSQTQIEQVGGAARADGFTDIVTVRLKTPINQGPIQKKYFRLMLTQ
jgi:hypothetical protein